MAERAPTTTFTLPCWTLRHSSYFSPTDKPLCITATSSPKRDLKRSVICGVKEISGTSTMASFSSNIAR